MKLSIYDITGKLELQNKPSRKLNLINMVKK